MDNEVIEAVSRCRMDIQELKGMMKMHFKDEVHHHHPCKELEHERRENRINGFLICLLCVCFMLCRISSCVTEKEIKRLEEHQKSQLELINKKCESDYRAFDSIVHALHNHKQAIENMIDVCNTNFTGLVDLYENHIRKGL